MKLYNIRVDFIISSCSPVSSEISDLYFLPVILLPRVKE